MTDSPARDALISETTEYIQTPARYLELPISERIAHLFSTPFTNNVVLFSLMLAVILIMPIITKRLHLPQVIGLILCGVALGPHALNVVDNSGAVSLFSTIGLLYIMFTAGLELDLNQFRINKNRSLIFGFLTYLGPLVILFPVAYWVYGLSFLQSFLVGSMFGTHTLIAYPAVSRLGVSKDPAVAVTVGGTILVDAGVLILLSVLIGISDGNLNAGFWINLAVSLAVFGLFMFGVVPRIADLFFRHWHHEKYLRFIFILFMVFISGLAAELAGMEPIIGAFVAGLVLNRFIPQHSPLMHDIEFVGNAIFIPFFLFTVGMLVDLGIVMQGSATIILAVILSAAALAGKFLAATSAQTLFKYTSSQRQVIFGLSSARVAATLAIGLVAHRAGLIDEIFLNATILLILITSITGSLVTEKAAHRLAVEQRSAHPENQHHTNAANEHILIPIANPAHAQALCNFASLIRAPQAVHPTTLLSVVPDDAHAQTAIRTFRDLLSQTLAENSTHGNVQISTNIDTSLSDGIARSIKENLSSVLIMGWPKSGLSEKIIGEKWKAIVHDINCMILWCDLPTPLTQNRRIILFTLENGELEWGFDDWFDKILFLASQSSLSIVHIGHRATHDRMEMRMKQANRFSAIDFHAANPFRPDLDSSDIKIQPGDWIIFASARPGSISYDTRCGSIPVHLSGLFPNNNKILIYPTVDPETFDGTDDFDEV